MATAAARVVTEGARVTLPGGRVVAYAEWPVPMARVLAEPEFQQQREREEGGEGGAFFAAVVNGVVTSAAADLPVRTATVQRAVTAASAEGLSMRRRTLVFVLGLAAFREFGCCCEGEGKSESEDGDGGFRVAVEHALGATSYMCTVDGGRAVSASEVARLRDRMRAVVAADLPIAEAALGYAEAVAHFAATGRPYSRAAVETSNAETTRVTVCDGWAALYFRALCPRTGLLADFDLRRADDGLGFALTFPSATRSVTPAPTTGSGCNSPAIGARASQQQHGSGSPSPSASPPFATAEEAAKAAAVVAAQEAAITRVYREYNEWGRLLCVGSAGELNQKVLRGEGRKFVAVSEALHNHKIVEIALSMRPRIAAQQLRMVLIAGPSASGKTTFAAKLGIQLRILGCVPVVLSVDNYFRPREETPLDENGEYDFEALEALRIDLLNDHLVRLMAGEAVDTPVFDFATGKPKAEQVRMQLPANGVLVMEGIHCLNPRLTPRVPDAAKYRIFLAPLSQLNLDELNFTSHAVGRLVRRVVRDYNHRGFSALDTLARWESVTRGEERHIFPFLHTADTVFNTALDYETSVLKTFAAPLLRSVTPDMPQYNLARNLLFILDSFFPIPHDHVHPDSLLREFIGGSFFE